ncbi:hypothetical protein [Streptomyces sp. NPDC001070]
MPIVKYAYDATLHREDTVGRRGGCSWHGQEACAEQPTSSYETPNGMMAEAPVWDLDRHDVTAAAGAV